MKAISQKALSASRCKNGLNSKFCLVLGLQWGHEGKYKLLNKLCPDYDFSCRYNGGTLTEPTELETGECLQILPHGIKFKDTKSLIGNGVVIDPKALLSDFDIVTKNGLGIKDRVLISDRANIVTCLHKEIANKLGSIREDDVWLNGEDITQSFKPIKMGLRMAHLIEDWSEFEMKYKRVIKTSEQLYNVKLSDIAIEEDLDNFKRLRSIASENNLVMDTVVHLNQKMKEGKRILVEDASSSTMDLDTGLYPFTDSFHTTTGAVCTGLGIPEEGIETTIGVFSAVEIIRKAFLKRIQDFPTHIQESDPAYESIKNRLESEYEVFEKDYAFGWADLNIVRHAELINKLDSMMLTHLDVLNDVENIRIAKNYILKNDDGETEVFHESLPAIIDDWEDMIPQFIDLPGWQHDLSDCLSFDLLPTEAQSFIRKIEQKTKKKIQYVSVNDEKDDGILRILR